jgi:hypothetical protein
MAFENNPTETEGEIVMKINGSDEAVKINDFNIKVEKDFKEITEDFEPMMENESSQNQPKFIENDTLVMLGD